MLRIGDIAIYGVPWALAIIGLLLACLAYTAFNARRRLWRLPGLVAVALAPLLMAATYTGLPIVMTNAQLGLLPSWQYFSVLRLGVNTVGDAPSEWFVPSGTACTISGGDIGSEVPTADGGCLNAAQTPSDVREYGVDPTGVADSTTKIAAAYATGVTPIYFPAGTYSFSSLSISANGQQTICASPRSTLLSQNSTSGDFVTVSGLWNSISHCGFQPSVRTTGYQVYFASSCYRCSIDDYEMSYHFDGIKVLAGAVSVGSAHVVSSIGSQIGPTAILFEGTSGSHASGLYVTNVLVNNAYPVTPATAALAKTWVTNTSYVSGNVVNVNNAIYQESATSCTSAVSGSGPSGYPSGSTPASVFSGTISDGSCTWKFVNDDEVGFFNNSWGYSAVLDNFVALNIFDCIDFFDSNSPASLSYPSFVTITNPSCDHNYHESIWLHAGFDIDITTPWLGSNTTGTGLYYDTAFTGKSTVLGGRIVGNAADGVHMSAGTGKQISISGSTIASNSQAAGTLPNVNIAAGVLGFSLIGNNLGADLQGSASTTWGVVVGSGASDYYVIENNICEGGNATGCVSDGGSGAHKNVSNNF